MSGVCRHTPNRAQAGPISEQDAGQGEAAVSAPRGVQPCQAGGHTAHDQAALVLRQRSALRGPGLLTKSSQPASCVSTIWYVAAAVAYSAGCSRVIAAARYTASKPDPVAGLTADAHLKALRARASQLVQPDGSAEVALCHEQVQALLWTGEGAPPAQLRAPLLQVLRCQRVKGGQQVAAREWACTASLFVSMSAALT